MKNHEEIINNFSSKEKEILKKIKDNNNSTKLLEYEQKIIEGLCSKGIIKEIIIGNSTFDPNKIPNPKPTGKYSITKKWEDQLKDF